MMRLSERDVNGCSRKDGINVFRFDYQHTSLQNVMVCSSSF